MAQLETLQFCGDHIRLIDQRLLPKQLLYVELHTVQQVFDAILHMQVRGAPAIGVTAAYGMVLAAQQAGEATFLADCEAAAAHLRSARPTAVNLPWALALMMQTAKEVQKAATAARNEAMLCRARAIEQEDAQANVRMGEHLLSLLWDGCGVLTHCNAGVLATTAYGTATSPFYLAQERGIRLHIYADETRPRLQGARLTAYELHRAGMDVTLICDNMAAVLMREKKIDAVITGCDRVAQNGDTANKIGTYNVSILCQHFGIPLYIAAPTSTIDLDCPDGAHIPIEMRNADEVRCIDGAWVAPHDVKVYNPSFDVTPHAHIAAIVTEKGIVRPPYTENLRGLLVQ